jgi:hypothetical protein
LLRTVFAGIPHHITQRGNRREDISSPLDDAYLWAAVRNVERNPVRADRCGELKITAGQVPPGIVEKELQIY